MNRAVKSNYISSLVMTFLVAFVGSLRAEDTLVEKVDSVTPGKIFHVTSAYQPQRPGFMSMHVGYLTLTSVTNEDVYIVGVSSPDYQAVSIHRSFQMDGAYQMESVGELKISAGERVSLEPGGMHLMLYEPLKQRKEGDVTTIVFTLCDGQSLSFEMPVVSA